MTHTFGVVGTFQGPCTNCGEKASYGGKVVAPGSRGLVHLSRARVAELITAVKGCSKDYSHHEGSRNKTREVGARARKPSKVPYQWPTSRSQSLPPKSSTASKNITTRDQALKTWACGHIWDKPEQSSWHTECVYLHLTVFCAKHGYLWKEYVGPLHLHWTYVVSWSSNPPSNPHGLLCLMVGRPGQMASVVLLIIEDESDS